MLCVVRMRGAEAIVSCAFLTAREIHCSSTSANHCGGPRRAGASYFWGADELLHCDVIDASVSGSVSANGTGVPGRCGGSSEPSKPAWFK
jgi:hypothetical protein